MSHPEVIVIGGGPAGSTTALLLARAGWRVMLLERKRFPRRKVCGEYLSGTNWPLLAALGLDDAFREAAGPSVEEVGLFVGDRSFRARLPRPAGSGDWGRALARDRLDTLLLEAARRAGATVLQPADCVELGRSEEGFHGRIRIDGQDGLLEFAVPVVVAALGSWETGPLAIQQERPPARAKDLFGFKAHFHTSSLPAGLMPLISFPGGYGGLVHCDGGRTSLSCCIRRDVLESLDRSSEGTAGKAVLAHICDTTTAVREAVGTEPTDGAWLAAGPIRPGIRRCYRDGIFFVGNAAGEAHPAVAEGISMAMQSAWLLAERMIPASATLGERGVQRRVGRAYSAAWRRSFAGRIYASELVARWAMRPRAVEAVAPLLNSWPELLTWGARLAGKSKQVVRQRASSAGKWAAPVCTSKFSAGNERL